MIILDMHIFSVGGCYYKPLMAPGFPGTFSPPLEAASLRAFRVPCLQFWDGAINPRTPPRASLGLGAVGRKDETKHTGTLEITMEHEGKSWKIHMLKKWITHKYSLTIFWWFSIGYHVRSPEVTCVCWQDWWWFIILAILCMKVCCGASSTWFFLGEPVATPWSELKWMGFRMLEASWCAGFVDPGLLAELEEGQFLVTTSCIYIYIYI